MRFAWKLIIFAFVKTFLRFKIPITFVSPITKPDWRQLSDFFSESHNFWTSTLADIILKLYNIC